MAEIQAKALYEFQGDTAGGELSFNAGEYLVILRQDIGEGWWEAQNSQGIQGLVPEAYLELQSLPEPSMPPPPPPADYSSAATHTQQYDQEPQDYDEEQQDFTYAHDQHDAHHTSDQLPHQQSYEDWDDDWDDDDDSSSTTTEQLGGSVNASSSSNKENRISSTGTVRSKGFHRFSTFAKSGGDAYLLGAASVNVAESDMMKIIDNGDGSYQWLPNDQPYTCMLASPKKESKLKGLKSFMTYQLTPTFNSIQVGRRYKHFDWLHERLTLKYATLCIPPLPDKQISGRYEEDFIQERMRGLQQWIDRMCKHPVIAKSEVFIHFLTCTDEKRWKVGKRRAEKDETQGAKFFLTVQTPPAPLDMQKVEKDVDQFARFSKLMDDNVKRCINVFEDNQRKHFGPFKKEYQKIGNAFSSLALGFELDENPVSSSLTSAIKHTGRTYDEIGKLFEQQPKNDLFPLLENLHEYKGLLSTFPDMIQVHKGAMQRVHECKKSLDESKMTESEFQTVCQRGDVLSYGILAEVDHFQMERITDYKMTMQHYLQQQIQFYQKITGKLEEALSYY